MSDRREMIDFTTRNSRTIEEIQISTETNLRSVANEEDDITGEKKNLEEFVDIDSFGKENTEEDLITTYENIEEQSYSSDSEDEFTEVLESNYNVRKSNDGLDHISSKNTYIQQIESVIGTGMHVLKKL